MIQDFSTHCNLSHRVCVELIVPGQHGPLHSPPIEAKILVDLLSEDSTANGSQARLGGKQLSASLIFPELITRLDFSPGFDQT